MVSYLFVTNRELALRLFVLIHKRRELLNRAILDNGKSKLYVGLGVFVAGLDEI